MSYPPKSKKQKLRISWAVGAIAIAIILLIIGRLTSDELRDDNQPETNQVEVDNIQINQTGDVFELNNDDTTEPDVETVETDLTSE